MKTPRPMIRFLLCVAILGLAGCSDDPTRPPDDDDTPEPTPETLDLRIERTNDFAMDLYAELSASEKNLIVSPHSIVTAFAMAYAGARGVTEREMAQVLHFNYPQAGFHSLVRQLNDVLESRGSSVGTEAFRLNIASGAWGRDDAGYLPSYLDTLSVAYGAGLQLLDFGANPEVARLTINQWVSDHTSGLIRDLFPQGSITPATYLALANTIFFRASWLQQFDPRYTRSRAFTRLDGSQVTVPVMSGEGLFTYDDGDGYLALALPYKGEEVSMLVIVPDPGTFKAFEASFSAAQVDSIASRVGPTGIIVSLPKFTFGTAYDLKQTLMAMGMPSAFQPGADFSGMDGTPDGIPWIDWVGHKAFIGVDEYGTLAAAGTGMGFTVGIPPHFDALRPFLFVIRDHATGTILFLGRVLDPSES
jgi:serpin B